MRLWVLLPIALFLHPVTANQETSQRENELDAAANTSSLTDSNEAEEVIDESTADHSRLGHDEEIEDTEIEDPDNDDVDEEVVYGDNEEVDGNTANEDAVGDVEEIPTPESSDAELAAAHNSEDKANASPTVESAKTEATSAAEIPDDSQEPAQLSVVSENPPQEFNESQADEEQVTPQEEEATSGEQIEETEPEEQAEQASEASNLIGGETQSIETARSKEHETNQPDEGLEEETKAEPGSRASAQEEVEQPEPVVEPEPSQIHQSQQAAVLPEQQTEITEQFKQSEDAIEAAVEAVKEEPAVTESSTTAAPSPTAAVIEKKVVTAGNRTAIKAAAKDKVAKGKSTINFTAGKKTQLPTEIVKDAPSSEKASHANTTTPWVDELGWTHYPWKTFPLKKLRYTNTKDCGCQIMWITRTYKRRQPKKKVLLKHNPFFNLRNRKTPRQPPKKAPLIPRTQKKRPRPVNFDAQIEALPVPKRAKLPRLPSGTRQKQPKVPSWQRPDKRARQNRLPKFKQPRNSKLLTTEHRLSEVYREPARRRLVKRPRVNELPGLPRIPEVPREQQFSQTLTLTDEREKKFSTQPKRIRRPTTTRYQSIPRLPKFPALHKQHALPEQPRRPAKLRPFRRPHRPQQQPQQPCQPQPSISRAPAAKHRRPTVLPEHPTPAPRKVCFCTKIGGDRRIKREVEDCKCKRGETIHYRVKRKVN